MRHLAAFLFVLVLASLQARADERIDFNRDVRPILAENCFACHGPDAGTREADLRLDLREVATGGDDPVIVPGKPDESRLYQRITSQDEFEVMPPLDSKKRLTEAHKETLRRWIAEGAEYQQHWSFEPVSRPEVPQTKTPTENPIDAFIAARLEKEGLPIAAEADKETLIRRVSFALTGLPPTIAEVDQFLADDSPEAYERMVDRYLTSPRYGEEMARHWLDVARYADTHGLHLDNERQMWAYRDWVVKAFNENLPYDDFTVWQVAGDLLPEPTSAQLIATGFNRCNVTTSEGGALEAEFRYRYAVERTSVVAQAWLGLTAGCAVCHDHKYDPLTTTEFYSLYAFFNNAADPAMDGNIDTTPPFLKLPTPEQKAAAAAAAAVEGEAREWLETVAGYTSYTDPENATSKAVRDVLFDDAFPIGATSRSSSRNAVVWELDPEFKAFSGRRALRQAFADNYTDTIEFKLRPITVPNDAAIQLALRVDPLSLPDSVTFSVPGKGSVTWKRTDAGFVRNGREEPELVAGQWTQLSIPAADLGLKPGDRIGSISLAQHGGIAWWDACALVGKSDLANDPLESLAAWRKAVGKNPPPDLPGELHAIVKEGPEKELSTEDAEKLRRFYLAIVARPVTEELAIARSAWEAARTARITAEEAPHGTFIYRDAEKPRESFVMLRGQYDKPGEKVEPGIPAFLPQISGPQRDGPLTRLELANWLVAEENPLMARVTVNRFWQQFFGNGLVKTSGDFGTQGELPSHPDLLDWLAVEFRDSGWDVKRFVKLLVLSETFRRDSRVATEILTRDPENRLHARGPRFRLDAEQIRDNALFVSGLINLKMGGRGVNPYQPPNIWEPVGYSDSNTRFYLQDHGEDLYRRSLYVFLKRTAPPPFMSNFDAPNREQVCLNRERSNTPLQALQLMNDTQHFEAARALAERVLAEGGENDADRITYLYRTVLSRHPDGEELALVTDALQTQRGLYQADPEGAAKAIQVGESEPCGVAPAVETAAWTMVANLVLNFDEALNRN